MRKFFTLSAVLIGFYSAAHAQIHSGIEVGADIGYNQAYALTSGGYTNFGEVSGYNFGLSADDYISDRWSIRVKVNHDQKGWHDGDVIQLTDVPQIPFINYQLNYLTVPVMADWHFGRKRNWYLHFGPYVGFLLNASDSNNDANVKSQFNSTDFGFDAGIGVKFPVANKVKLFVEADGQGSIINILANGGAGNSFRNERSALNFGAVFDLN